MPELALLIAVLYLLVAFGLKAVLLRRSTGTAGFRGITGRPGSAEWLGGVLFVVALVAAVVAPGLQAVDVLDPFTGSSALATLGLVVTMVGVVLTLWAQGSMGGSVEEPYLRTAHADRYVAYARRVGRFFPGLGRLDAHGAARGHLGSYQ